MDKGVRLAAVGDVMIGDSPTTVGLGVASRYNVTELERLLKPIAVACADADVVFGNLESCLVLDGVGSTRRARGQMRHAPAAARALRLAGFSALNLANNHAMQHGVEGFTSTVRALTAAGITCVGLRGSDGWTSSPARIKLREGEVGFLGYCLRPRQYGDSEPLYAEGTPDQIVNDVQRLSSMIPNVVVSLHWGEEFAAWPSEAEVAFGRRLISAGCAVIVGHHPHVVRPVERFQGGLIAYSLGNAITDMVWEERLRTGAILKCTLPEAGMSAEVSLVRADDQYHPRPLGPGMPLSEGVVGAPEAEYAAAVKDSVRQQRWSSYRYTACNAARFPLAVLLELGVTTLRNRIKSRRKGAP